MLRRFFVACVFLLGVAPLPATAQSIFDSLVSADPFTISMSPQYPSPRSTVTISVQSANIDISNARMQVKASGKEIYTGSVRAVEVPLSVAGARTTITVTLTSNGTSYEQSLAVRPQDVALVVEPRASVAPLYPGKPLIPLNGNSRIVAVAGFRSPDGSPIDPSTLAYAWTVDGARQPNLSGIGKNSIIAASPLEYRERAVSVVVQSQDGTLVSGASVSLTPHEPLVRIYENDPLLGIRFERALYGNHTIVNAESSLYASPFSFPSITGPVSLTWFLNGQEVEQGTGITLRPTGEGQGSASLSLVAATDDLTRATADLPITFGAQRRTNFFGL